MTAYYNEWNKDAAAWLRNLMAEGLIMASGQVLQADSASCQEGDDMSGREPTRVSATGSSCGCGPLRFAHDPACVPPQAREIRRRLHRLAVHRGLFDRTEQDSRRAIAWPSLARDTAILALDCASTIPWLSGLSLHGGRHQSMFFSGSDRVGLGNASHKRRSRGHGRLLFPSTSSGMRPRMTESKTYYRTSDKRTICHTGCSFVFSLPHHTTSCERTQ